MVRKMDIKSIVESMTLEQKIRLCNGRNDWQTMPIEELDVPPLLMSDGTNGIRFQKGELKDGEAVKDLYEGIVNSGFDTEFALENTYKATCFPSGSTLACSWNPTLAREIGAAVAVECKSIGICLLLGPGMNIRRHPLTGRNFEYYSEDPVLSGDIAAGMVTGVQQEGIGATVKHFVSNNSDTRRTILNCIIEERALREIYLAGFERVINKAKPAAVMASYPSINGTPACQNKWLLNDVLRDDWGYQGITISDWGGVKDTLTAVDAGLDLQMPYSPWFLGRVKSALQSGDLTEEQIDAHCKRMLELILKYSREGKEKPEVDWGQQHALAQKAAAECSVLLKNGDNLLPLNPQKSQKIAVLGELAKYPLYQGTGCAIVNAMKVDIPLDEMEKIAPDAELQYAPGYFPDDTTTDALLQEAVDIARSADVAIIFVGSRLPQESDEFDRPNMDLESGHLRLMEAVFAVQPNTIVVVFNGDVVSMPWASKANAVLDMWYGGEGCGNAVAGLLFGLYNPSGKLPVSIPLRLSDTPAYLDFPHEQDAARYREGVFVGYRYYDWREMEVLYPFGYGLSYTSFSYDEIRVENNGQEGCEVEVRITNTGNTTGAEVIQLYVAPHNTRVFRPVKELKGFEKVQLAPDESTVVRFELNRRDFAYYDDVLGKWRVDGGQYEIYVGGSSRDLPLTAEIEIEGDADTVLPLALDSHYSDVFSYPAAGKVYFDFLVEKGLLNAEQVSPEVKKQLIRGFWGVAQHLDTSPLSPDMVSELLERMNAAINHE
jgi:beta-glucosidase